MISNLIVDESAGTITGFGTVGGSSDPTTAIANMISATVGLLTVIAGIYFIFNLITASIGMITNAGDKGNLEVARTKMLHSVVGLVVTISAMFIIGILSTVFGIPDILDFGGMINALR